MTALDHEMPFSHSTRELLKHFIQGCTKKNHPIDVVHALYCHPYYCPNSRYEPSYPSLPSFVIPLNDHQPNLEFNERKHTYTELQQYFIDKSMKCLKFEMDWLLCDEYWWVMSSDMGQFDWEVILGFLIESVQRIIMMKAPIIWMLLTSLAVEHC